jgi:hypothetical protein
VGASPLRPAARQALENLCTYLETHHEHLDYARYRQEGLPIGSGCVESACKWLIQSRFKGVGIRWSESGLNHLLHLRLAWTNERFASLYTQPPPTDKYALIPKGSSTDCTGTHDVMAR